MQMSEMEYHIPALLPQVLEALDIRADGVYVDVTYGGGGHSRAIVERLSAAGHLYGFDQDRDAVERCMHDGRFTMVYSNFRYLTNFMRYYGVEHVDGILADLGVSFHHFDSVERGFTFREGSAPLDMRMNGQGRVTAASVIADSDEATLSEIFRLYGEMQGAGRIARAIVKARQSGRAITTAGELMQVVEPLINPARRKKELAQLFQALRIVVNDEIGALRTLLSSSLRLLAPGGRLAVISYHSLEDRLVKNFMRSGNIEGRIEKDFYGNSTSPLRLLNSKPIVPGEAEIEANPRSRSAKLRVAVKL